jgi:glucan phosphoethanolaminetransferase (alkaline phosphatase superfamily)
VILASNGLWGKTITINILKDYVLSVHDLIAVLPVEGWIFYTAFFILLILIFLLYKLAAPRYLELVKNWTGIFSSRRFRLRFLLATAAFFVLVILFRGPILNYKRTMHFGEEPVLEFVFGPMWYPSSLEDIYSTRRQQNSLRERECIANVTDLPSAVKPHITLVVLVDALRNDHLPMYGYSRMTAPFLDSLYRAGNLLSVKHAFSTSSGTLIGVAGLFSSKNWEDFGYTGLSLMKFMNKTHHKTYAFLTGHHRTWYGLTAIYKNDCNVFYESARTYSQMDLDDLTTLSEIQRTKLDPNSFVYIHLLSAHELGKKNEMFRKFLPDKIGIGTDKKTAFINNYDNGILQMDYFMRNLFQKLNEDDLLDNATVYVLADHGHLFGEYGQWNHAGSINPVVVSIPMLIYDNDKTWYKNTEQATLKDVAPTIADRLGYPLPACWDGQSLGKPPHDFSIRINVENKCDLPEATLSAKEGSFTLDMYNDQKKLKKKATLLKDETAWKVEDISN